MLTWWLLSCSLLIVCTVLTRQLVRNQLGMSIMHHPVLMNICDMSSVTYHMSHFFHPFFCRLSCFSDVVDPTAHQNSIRSSLTEPAWYKISFHRQQIWQGILKEYANDYILGVCNCSKSILMLFQCDWKLVHFSGVKQLSKLSKKHLPGNKVLLACYWPSAVARQNSIKQVSTAASLLDWPTLLPLLRPEMKNKKRYKSMEFFVSSHYKDTRGSKESMMIWAIERPNYSHFVTNMTGTHDNHCIAMEIFWFLWNIYPFLWWWLGSTHRL